MLVLLHDRLAVAAALYLLALGLWGFVGGLRRAEVSPSYRGALVIGEGLLVAQVLLGVLLVLLGHRPAEWVHFLYGILVPLLIPFVATFLRGRPGRRATLYYGFTALFLFALALRAIATGG